MSNTCKLRVSRFAAAVISAACMCQAPFAIAQSLDWSNAASGLLPILGMNPSQPEAPAAPTQPPMPMPRRAPMARLIENPDQSEGAPPYALSDRTGTIQRYVEP